jgi:L-ascorbate metabolism protein UlaG (beta-lactamase superfamily)
MANRLNNIKNKDTRKGSKLKALFLAGLSAAVIVSCCSIAIKDDEIMKSPSFKNGKFVNAVPNKEYTTGEYVRMTWEFFFGDKDGRVPKDPLPVVVPEKFSSPPSNTIQYAWLGHSSIILELEGKRFLLDPVFSERASFSQWIGPKRFHPTPISLEELPHIDAVLISHNHYDHLDRMVIEHMKGNDTQFYVPLGIKKLILKWGIKEENIVEFDWWDETEIGGIRVISTPARHFSARGVLDRDEAFWASWSIVGEKHNVFFSGDTGMTPQFSEIGERLGPFDITFMKIGAYDEQWPDMHIDPEEAVQAHLMLRGDQLVPIHWGTFDLGLHHWQEPVERLIVAAEKENVSILSSKIGETVVPSEHINSYWWQGME